MQIIFQLVLITDGTTSFATFNYNYLRLSNGAVLTPVEIGFSRGDQIRLANFDTNGIQQNQNQYRIDGEVHVSACLVTHIRTHAIIIFCV